MEAHEFVDGDDDLVWQIDWNDLPDFTGILDEQAPAFTTSPPNQGLSNPSPDSVSSWIGEVENLLMNDDADDAALEPNNIDAYDDFLLDIPVHSPTNASVEVVPSRNSNHSSQPTADEDPHNQNGRITGQETGTDVFADIVVDSPIPASTNRHPTPIAGNSDVSSHGSGNGDLEKVQQAINDVEDPDDPVSKKRRRQLRNRDAAVRSRERKKMYVKDLEVKSRYLEGECRRLGRLLQCFIAENQALRLSLQRGSAFDASSAKQESAVLLLESLLLGSLLWFLGIMCLFNLPTLPKSIVEAASVESVEKKGPGGLVAVKGAGSNVAVESFVKSRGCKASRTKMKLEFFLGLRVSA